MSNIFQHIRTVAVGMVGLTVGWSSAQAATLFLERIATRGDITNPVHAAAPAGDPSRLFIADLKSGEIRIYDRTAGALLPTPFLTVGDVGQVGEQGVFAIAFAPDYATSGKFYVSKANAAGDHQVVEYTVSSSDPNVADSASARVVITVDHPDDGAPQHYAGWTGFGKDGYLYVTTGDSNADPINDNAQQTGNQLGSILRIDPNTDAFPLDPFNNYSAPADNPFVGESGDDAVFAYGLRNPFRASFDPVSGALLIADVGEDRVEEIDLGAAGANYGWPGFEGTQEFDPSLLDGEPVTFPIYEYAHGDGPFEGFSVTGGEFYQGPIDALDGMYFFGDFVSSKVWSFVFDATTGTISDLLFWDIVIDAGFLNTLVSFGTDGDGNLYILDIFGDVWIVADAEIPLPGAFLLFLVGVAGLRLARSRRLPPVDDGSFGRQPKRVKAALS